MTKIGDLYELKTGPDGKVTIEFDTKKAEKKKPVSARRAKPKTKFQAVTK